MSPRTMRILFVNVSVIVALFAMIQADTDIPLPTSAKKENKVNECSVDAANITQVVTSKFFMKELLQNHMRSLIEMYFHHSLNYLFTSQQYASQFVQRPGMAKLLKEKSDKKWEQGLDILKKAYQRGAMTEHIFEPSFVVTGKGYLGSAAHSGVTYVRTLEKLVKDSHKILKNTMRLYEKALDDKCGDAEISHYFEDYMEAEAKTIRELAGHHFTLKSMEDLGVAISVFDSNI